MINEFRAQLAGSGRNAGPVILRSLWLSGTLEPIELNPLVARVWSLAEFPEGSIGLSAWVAMFREAGFVTDDAGVERPRSPLRVFRGTTWGRRRRMSWTSDADKARWFARRASLFGFSGMLVSATAPPAGVLGILQGRNESEVIVDPATLTLVTRIEAVPWTTD